MKTCFDAFLNPSAKWDVFNENKSSIPLFDEKGCILIGNKVLYSKEAYLLALFTFCQFSFHLDFFVFTRSFQTISRDWLVTGLNARYLDW